MTPTPVHDYLPDARDEHVAVCAVCGFPLLKLQIAADFTGTCINYMEHATLPFAFAVCNECLQKMVEYTNNGPDEAYRRTYSSAVITRQCLDEYDTPSTEKE